MTAGLFNGTELAQDNAIIVEGPLRSGHKLDYDGSIVILGDVNAGAEVRATGHILVFGALRGMAHCGSAGNTAAKVSALLLFPTQLRIADHITCPPRGYGEIAGRGPEIAGITDNRVVIEQLTV